MLRIRNNVAFHYDGGIVAKALEKAAGDYPDDPLPFSMGQSTIDWHFEPGDRIVDRIVVREIFGISKGADVRVEVDKIVLQFQQIGERLVDFAGYFIRHHTAR